MKSEIVRILNWIGDLPPEEREELLRIATEMHERAVALQAEHG